MYKRFLSILLAVCILMLSFSVPAQGETAPVSAPLTAGSTQNGMVRVRLSSLGNFSTLNLTVYGSYSVNGQSSQTIGNGAAVTVKFNSASGQWTLTANGSSSYMGSSFRLCRHETSGQNGVKIAQGRAPSNLYPGDFQFIARGSSGGYSPWVIAHIYMEDYLYGVLPYEMGNSSGLEALKAQAVAARTYTLRAMSKSSSSLYDVVDTTSDQVYSGTPSGSANCKAAVDATKGIAVKNGSAFTATYYTASNGGQTESIKNAWGTNGLSYLGVKDDPYDLANPDSRKASFTVNASGTQSNSKLGSLLNQKAAKQFGSGATVTGVSAITPHTPKYAAPSRLYTKLDFSITYTRNGTVGTGVLTFDIFNELESALSMSVNSGSNELWSVTQSAVGFTVTARRYGHGIGMSQRGAMYMAQLGYTYDQILGFYYEGCTRVEYTLTRSILSPIVSGQESQQQVITELPAALETPAPTQTPAPALSAVVTTQSGSLNLRASASISAKVLRTIPQYETIPILERGAAWCKTSYGGYTGYVMAAYLTFSDGSPSAPVPTALPTAAPTNPPAAASLSARVTTPQGSLNLRAAPKSTAKVLRTIPQYDMVSVLQRGDPWTMVAYAGTTGYVMTQFLTFQDGPAPAGTPVPTLTLSPAPTAAPVSASTGSARVMTPQGSLNLRASARDTAKVLRTIPPYDVVSVLERGADWCRVSYEGTTGYVMTKFLSFDVAGSAPAMSPAPTAFVPSAPAPSAAGLRFLSMPVVGKIVCTASTLNLRAACSTDAKIILEMPKNDFLIINAVGDTWCAVVYEGVSGYCMTKYLEFEMYE